MADIALAFLWHQHQPYYPDDLTGDNPMPWVRLHGVKDYYGMALHLLEYPEMRCTINLVPSLLTQILAYTERGAVDRPLQMSRIRARDLNEVDALYLLDHFFMANPEQMIRPWPRYWDLYQRRAFGKEAPRDALRRFAERDLRDLQTLFNLAWIHPLAFERDQELRDLRQQGRYFSENDKDLVLHKHLEILGQIIPLHRKLAESGQVELTTTPFYHPILPLLFDRKLAREAMPDVKLPRYTGGYPEDAAVHVRRAIDFHTATFGRPPVGMWPAEGSVCQPMIPLLAQHGIRWIATDEEVLGQATQGFVSRGAHGLRNPGHLYRPYAVREGEDRLSIVFRDHALSDMIGFQYQRSKGAEAAQDFLRHLQHIRATAHPGDQPLVSVILDGENCWEHYPEGGVPFLRALYDLCTTTPWLEPVRLGDYLEKHPPRDTLPYLSAGSWIHHNFAIWIGHAEDNAGWDILDRTRDHLRQRAQQAHVPPERLAKAWEELYIAEGSDWFWWYGDDHSSAQDALFDYLFRKHLQNVYALLGDPAPSELRRPISRFGQRPVHTLPVALLNVKIDGRETYFEWISAGRYTCQNERGTMALVTRGPIKELYFGFNLEELLVRVDFDRPARQALAAFEVLRVVFEEPGDLELRLEHPGRANQRLLWSRRGEDQPLPVGVTLGLERIVELAIPFAALGIAVDAPLQFFVELLENQQSRDRAPREGTISLMRPAANFEQVMWDV